MRNDEREIALLNFHLKNFLHLNHLNESPVGIHCSHIGVRTDGL